MNSNYKPLLIKQIIQLMKRNSPFQIAAHNTLKITEVKNEDQRKLNNTFQGQNDLRRQLNKKQEKDMAKMKNTKIGTIKSQTMKSTRRQEQTTEEDALMMEVAALDNFKAPVTRDKTKNMIENIKLRRREKHIEAFSNFKQDLNDYRQNLQSIYSSLYQDTLQVLNIKQVQMKQFLNSQTDQYLLNRERQLLQQVDQQVEHYKFQTDSKIKQCNQDIERIKSGRGNVIDETCGFLEERLNDIAFVLEGEVREITEKEKKEIQQFQEQTYQNFSQKTKDTEEEYSKKFEQIMVTRNNVKQKWKQLKQQNEINLYIAEADTLDLKHPEERTYLYQQIVKLQQANKQRKMKLIGNLIKQELDILNKQNVQKWIEHLKMINEAFDRQFDDIFQKLKTELEGTKARNFGRYNYLKERLIYIGNKNEEEIEALIKERCQSYLNRNNQKSNELLKDVANYVEEAEQRQNQALEKMAAFINQLATKSDDSIKNFGTLSQQYELEKAKILDEDDEVIEKLTTQLADLKKQLKQSLHHIKLDEIQKLSFEKIDQIQEAYRKTHENNRNASAKRPGSIEEFMKKYQAQIAQIFCLYSQARRDQLVEKNKKQAEEFAQRKLEEEQKKKLEEENKLIEEAKKKGGKPPAPSKKDPKKQAAQQQERKKQILAEIGVKKIQQLTTSSGNIWLVYKNLEQICKEFYPKRQPPKEQQKSQEPPKQQQAEIQQPQEKKILSEDQLDDEIKDILGQTAVSKQFFLNAKQLASNLEIMRNTFFVYLGQKGKRIITESQSLEQQFIQESLENLDNRLKEHYSLKGKLEAEIYLKRSSQITGHKKEYESYARNVRQKMDLQTEKFNYLLEKSLQLLKNHIADQKVTKEQLSQGKNLSQFQTASRKSHQNYKRYINEMKQINNDLSRLANNQVDSILKKNEDFIKKAKLIENGGQFSQSQVDWYKDMMTEINQQIEDQKAKRNQKGQQVQQHSQKKSKEMIEIFDKEYANLIEQSSAKDGTGKKYGRPKRIAQQKIRLQMNKCEQAQINIDKQIEHLNNICQYNQQSLLATEPPKTLEWRQKLMTLQTCISRYSKHIEALVPNLKIKAMVRVNYNETIPDAGITPEQQEQDKKRVIDQLKELGSLSEQKDERPFMKYVEDIEKIIGDESRLIYVGDKAKYITGNDKIPDFLRAYIANMKKNAEQFRQNSVRALRDSCNQLSSLTQSIVNMFIDSLEMYFNSSQSSNKNQKKKQFFEYYQQQSQKRQYDLKMLRPGLNNPKCQDDLSKLDKQEKVRQDEYGQKIVQMKKIFEDEHFSIGTKFLNSILNNYEFLILFFDSIYLFEDFAKIQGDEDLEKIHLDVKKLMLMKQKGVAIDSNSERNLKKKWEGVDLTILNFGENTFSYAPKKAQETKEKDKKGAKKQSKDKKVEQTSPVTAGVSKEIETFKTWRQKYVFIMRQRIISNYSSKYKQILEQMTESYDTSAKQNESFKIKWDQIAQNLYLK